MLFGYIHCLVGAFVGAFRLRRTKKAIINNGLGVEFGGYTAHHLTNLSQ
jgi:hypothetical protein